MSIQSITSKSITQKKFYIGEVIYSEHTKPRFYYEIKKGEVKLENNNFRSNESVNRIYRTNEFFGVGSLLCNQPYTATAIAHTECILFIFARQHFLTLLKTNYNFHIAITRSLSKELLYYASIDKGTNSEEDLYSLLKIVYNPPG